EPVSESPGILWSARTSLAWGPALTPETVVVGTSTPTAPTTGLRWQGSTSAGIAPTAAPAPSAVSTERTRSELQRVGLRDRLPQPLHLPGRDLLRTSRQRLCLQSGPATRTIPRQPFIDTTPREPLTSGSPLPD